MNHIVIRKFNRTFDIFFGSSGWSKWSRYAAIKTNNGIAIKHLAGVNVDNNTYAYVKQRALEML